MQAVKNVYAIAIEFEPNQKYNRQVFVLATSFQEAFTEMNKDGRTMQENEKVRAITIIAEDVIY